MRKVILALILAVASMAASAQFRYGPMVGVTLNNLVFNQDLISVTQRPAYMAGLQTELMFPGIGFGIDVGLQYNQQGARVNLGSKEVWSSLGYGNEQVYIHAIHIPVHVRFKYTRLFGLEEKIAPFVYGGPEFNIQVAHGHCKAFDYSGGDFGLAAGVGAELYQRWQVSASYTWGMSYVAQTKLLDNFSARGRQWALKVAYMF